eukprot:TRINITY_DN3393_c0_g1_i1.p1 TRINITY_DN3393_c0_g1~~TRINITY_DN3393_c0_g1_i1.p1  ORF type:complete len:414 (+),score=94.51 TRINITY_DN3393_c0_g1_i1:3-1244(+)
MKCEQGHALVRMTAGQLRKRSGYSTGYTCDRCRYKWSRGGRCADGDAVAHCDTCQYDLCPACIATTEPSTDDQAIEQWVSEVLDYSSQYDNYSYPAKQVIGKPKRLGGSSGNPWLMSTSQDNFVVVQFAKPVQISMVEVYEAYYPGHVLKILAKPTDNSSYVTLFSRAEKETDLSESRRVFCPPLLTKEVFSQVLRVEFARSTDYVQIEGIKITGDPLEKPKPEYLNDMITLFDNITAVPHTTLGGEELTKFFTSMGVTDDVDPMPFVVFYKLKATKGTFEISKEQFTVEYARRRARTMDDVARLSNDWKTAVLETLYDQFYEYVFDYMRGERKALPVPEALSVWRVLGLPTKWNLHDKWAEYLGRNEKLALPRDTLMELLPFSRAFTAATQEYDETSSWPLMFDSFVEWLRG